MSARRRRPSSPRCAARRATAAPTPPPGSAIGRSCARAVENATISSYGRQFPAIFWLHHSLDLARLLKETPKRIAAPRPRDRPPARRRHQVPRLRAVSSTACCQATYELVQRLAGATEEAEEALFPRLLTRMRDNVLVFTEDHISRDLAELAATSTAPAHRRPRPPPAARRAGALARRAARGRPRAAQHRRPPARHRPGRAARRAAEAPRLREPTSPPARPTNPARLLPPALVPVWESLLLKLKEFELLHALRRAMVPVERRAGRRARLPRAVRRRRNGYRRQRRAAPSPPLPRHPAARLHGALGGRPARRALRA